MRLNSLIFAAKRAEQIVKADGSLNARVRNVSACVNGAGNPRIFACAHRYLLKLTRQSVGIIEIYIHEICIITILAITVLLRTSKGKQVRVVLCWIVGAFCFYLFDEY